MFNATGTGPSATQTTTLENAGFFPALDLSDFRETMRVDNVATAERALHALRAAMMETNRRLAKWMNAQLQAGVERLENAEAAPGQPQDEKEQLYIRAVYSLAKANLVERYRDYDSTAKAQGRADHLEENIDDLRRDAAWAINDISNTARTTVDLI